MSSSSRPDKPGVRCPHCGERGGDHREVAGGRYAYLLGLYLGDGCLSRHARTWQLRIYTDVAYPSIIEEARRAMAALSPRGHAAVYRPPGRNYVVINSYSLVWFCLFPQHAPGKKHHRRIVLEPWQRTIVVSYPGPFLRGLIQTDGWRGQNRVRVKDKDYSYPRYQFSSRSDDIRALFTWGCDLLDIAWRPWGRWHISVARRQAVARLDEFVGPKT